MTDREIIDEVTLLLRNAREAKNGTARALDDGEELFGFVIGHHDYMAMHGLLNQVADNNDMTTQEAADYLGVSRPHFVKLLEANVLPHRMVGTHRRVTRGDVETYARAQQPTGQS